MVNERPLPPGTHLRGAFLRGFFARKATSIASMDLPAAIYGSDAKLSNHPAGLKEGEILCNAL